MLKIRDSRPQIRRLPPSCLFVSYAATKWVGWSYEQTNVRHLLDITATVDIRARNCWVPQRSISKMVSPYNHFLIISKLSKSSHHPNICVAEIKRNSIQKKLKKQKKYAYEILTNTKQAKAWITYSHTATNSQWWPDIGRGNALMILSISILKKKHSWSKV